MADMKRYQKHPTARGTVDIPVPSIGELQARIASQQAQLSHLKAERRPRTDLIRDKERDIALMQAELSAAQS